MISDRKSDIFEGCNQSEAPLRIIELVQHLISFTGQKDRVWKKYGKAIRGIVKSYFDGRPESVCHDNGYVWSFKPGIALSWMNAYINGMPVTERTGYQVETNAFWYNAICFAIEMEEKYGAKDGDFVRRWTSIRELVRASFQPTFWNPDRGCLADYVDNGGQNRDIRPNQLYAIWVKYSPVDEELVPSIFKVVDSELRTARGIRTLSPRDPKYKGVYEGTQIERDLAYHQGCTRPFLLEPYVAVGIRLNGESFIKKAEWLCEGFYDDLGKHGVGAFSELYDGDPPHEPHGAISSALSTAGLLSVEYMLDKFKEA